MIGRALRSRIRPARPLTPFVVSALALLVWWLVAHNSGSGWVQALGDVAFGMVLIGLVGPGFALLQVQVDVAQSPADGTAGLPVVVVIRSSRRVRAVPVVPPGAVTFIGPRWGGTDAEVTIVPALRGLHENLTVDVATAAPFGIQWWTRRVVVTLPRRLHVAPRMGRPVPLPRWVDDRAGSRGAPRVAETGEARGVREYRAGDRRRRVHWGATAHAGHLMVREAEEPEAHPVTLLVHLPEDGDAAERTAEDALASVAQLLDSGLRVVLATTEAAGEVVAEVGDRHAAGRRLALAVGGSGPATLDLLP